MTTRRRLLAVGGVAGPAAFVGAWAVLGATRQDYSPAHDAISRLAALGAPTRTAMTVGLVGYGVGVVVYAVALRDAVRGWAWAAAALSGAATFGVAAFPLGPPGNDIAHGTFATTAYAAVAATPLLAAGPMSARSGPGWGPMSRAAAALSAGLLLGTTAGPWTGLFQRLGLTVADLWIVASAVDLLRHRAPSGPEEASARGLGP